MHEQVIIRSNKYGLEVHLNPTLPFEELRVEVKHKFQEAGKFFRGATMAVSFEERVLSREEEEELIELISNTADVHIVCVIDNNKTTEKIYRSIIEQSQEDAAQRDGLFYRGNLKRRQLLESESSVVVLGNVEHGAKIVARGNIIVMGDLKGTAYAGASGDRNAIVAALSMKPQRLKIADLEAIHISYEKEETDMIIPKIAMIDGEHIYMDPLIS